VVMVEAGFEEICEGISVLPNNTTQDGMKCNSGQTSCVVLAVSRAFSARKRQ